MQQEQSFLLLWNKFVYAGSHAFRSTYSMILVHPPVVRPCEPPAGIARLAGAFRHHGIPVHVWDANIECLLFLMETTHNAYDTWTKGALRRLDRNLKELRSPHGYINIDRYTRAVRDLGRVLQYASGSNEARVGLADYHDTRLSALKSSDLLHAAEHPEISPFYSFFSMRLSNLLEVKLPGSVGFSLNYLSQALTTFAMIGYLKKTFSGLRIILGGGLVSSWMSRPDWKNPWQGLVDIMIAGPGEKQLLKLHGTDQGPLFYTPDYSGFSFDNYFAPGNILPYSASGGCYWSRCSFCPEKTEKNLYRPVATSQVISDLNNLKEQTRPCLVHFLDNALSPALLKHLCEHPLGIPWYGFARITPKLADEEFCRNLKNSGCVMLKIGIESGDQHVLDSLGKGIELSIVSRALKTLKSAGISSYVYLLFGTPAESEFDARKTLKFTIDHAAEIDFLNLAIFNLPRFSPDAGNLKTGEFYEGDLSLYLSFVHPSGWNRASVRNFLDKEFKKHPAIRPILRQDPTVFTSNHAPFFATAVLHKSIS